jgi:hypothetical protein
METRTAEAAEKAVQRFAMEKWGEPLRGRGGPRREGLLLALRRLPEVLAAEPLAFASSTVGEVIASALLHVRTEFTIERGRRIRGVLGRSIRAKTRVRHEPDGDVVEIPAEVMRALRELPSTPEPSFHLDDAETTITVLTSRPEALPASFQGAARPDRFGAELREGLRAIAAFLGEPSSLSRPLDVLLGSAKREASVRGETTATVEEHLADKLGTTRAALLRARSRKPKRRGWRKDTSAT